MKHMVEDTRRHRWQKWWKKKGKIWKGKSLTAKASKRVKTEQATQAGSQRRGKFSHTRAPSSSRQMHFHFISIYFNFFCHRFFFSFLLSSATYTFMDKHKIGYNFCWAPVTFECIYSSQNSSVTINVSVVSSLKSETQSVSAFVSDFEPEPVWNIWLLCNHLANTS